MNKFLISRITILLVCCLFLAGATESSGPEGTWKNNLLRFALLTGGLIIFIVLSAFYSGSETATVSLDRP